jgi:hypothetical protein
VATYSTLLGLKLNTGSDPFLLSDFIANWGILDQSPGVFVCTSLTKPAWGAAQAGRKIFMTDLKQTQFWTGTAFQDELNSVPVFVGGTYIDTAMSRNNSSIFTVFSFTTSRPGSASIILVGTYQCSNQQSQDVFQSVVFDGTRITLGNFREQIRFEGNQADASGIAGTSTCTVAEQATMTTGTHQVGIQCDVGSGSAAVTLIGVKALVFISQYSVSNSL